MRPHFSLETAKEPSSIPKDHGTGVVLRRGNVRKIERQGLLWK